MNLPQIITVGRVSLDLFSQNIGASFEDIRGFDCSVGGSPTNIAIGCARLGLRAAPFTAVGDDMVGRLVLRRLEIEGVVTAYVSTKREGHTPLAIVGVQPPDRFPLTFYRQNPADIHLTIEEASNLPLGKCQAVVLSGTALSRGTCREAVLYIAEQAEELPATTVLDLDLRRDQWSQPLAFGACVRSLLPLLDVVIGTEEEFYAVFGQDMQSVRDGSALSAKHRQELDDSLTAFQMNHPSMPAFIVKRGARGVSVFDGQDTAQVGSFAVRVVNTVGAGDAFASGFLYGLIQGWNWPKCASYGNACGAIVVTRNGCSDAFPRVSEVEEFITTQGTASDNLQAKESTC